VAVARYGEVMTFLILMAGFAAAISTIVGFVAWRDRRSRGSFVDPSISRDAIVQAYRQAVPGRVAEADIPAINFVGHGRRSHS
jgi:hypothetical protein